MIDSCNIKIFRISQIFQIKSHQNSNVFTNTKIYTKDKKWSFPLRIFSLNVAKSAADLVTFTEEILNGKLNFLSSDTEINDFKRNKRPTVCFTDDYIKSFRPSSSSYSINTKTSINAKTGRKYLALGGCHVKQIQRNNFNKEIYNRKSSFWSFGGENSKQLDH